MTDIAPIVHMVDYASQPNIQFRCDETWDTPSWDEFNRDPKEFVGVYKAHGGRFYTFEEDKITCPVCKKPDPEPPMAA